MGGLLGAGVGAGAGDDAAASLLGASGRAGATPTGTVWAMSDTVRPFRIAVAEDDLVDLRDRLARTRWPEAETVGDWSQGMPLAYTRELCAYWADTYDWRATEARLNASRNSCANWTASTSTSSTSAPPTPAPCLCC